MIWNALSEAILFFRSHPYVGGVLLCIGVLFIVAVVAGINVIRSKYKIPDTPSTALVLDKIVYNLRSEANLLASKLQTRITGYTILNFVLVMIEILGSLFFAYAGLPGHSTANLSFTGGPSQQKTPGGGPMPLPSILGNIMGGAILLAGSLKAGFQPNTRKVLYAYREWVLSNRVAEAELLLVKAPQSATNLADVAQILTVAIKDATEPLKQ